MSRSTDDSDTTTWHEGRWSTLAFVCRKCAKRAERGGLRTALRDALKARTGERRIRVLATGCLGICPKRGVALATPRHLAARQVVVLGNDHPVADAADALVSGLAAQSNSS